jgi:hypothetical protein
VADTAFLLDVTPTFLEAEGGHMGSLDGGLDVHTDAAILVYSWAFRATHNTPWLVATIVVVNPWVWI